MHNLSNRQTNVQYERPQPQPRRQDGIPSSESTCGVSMRRTAFQCTQAGSASTQDKHTHPSPSLRYRHRKQVRKRNSAHRKAVSHILFRVIQRGFQQLVVTKHSDQHGLPAQGVKYTKAATTAIRDSGETNTCQITIGATKAQTIAHKQNKHATHENTTRDIIKRHNVSNAYQNVKNTTPLIHISLGRGRMPARSVFSS